MKSTIASAKKSLTNVVAKLPNIEQTASLSLALAERVLVMSGKVKLDRESEADLAEELIARASSWIDAKVLMLESADDEEKRLYADMTAIFKVLDRNRPDDALVALSAMLCTLVVKESGLPEQKQNEMIGALNDRIRHTVGEWMDEMQTLSN